MKTIDRQACAVLRKDLEAVLAAVATKHGVKIEVGRMTFNAQLVNVKVTVATIGEGGEAATKEATDFKRFCYRYGLKATDLGRMFRVQGRTFKLTGCAPRSSKYPLTAKEVGNGGKGFKFSVSSVLGNFTDLLPHTKS